MKKQYTFEDWLADKPYYQPVEVVPEGYTDPLDQLSTAQRNYLVYNHPENLVYNKVLSEDEYQKISGYQKQVYSVALSEFSALIPNFVDSKLKSTYDLDDKVMQKRVTEIDEFIDNTEPTLFHNVVRGEVPPISMSGQECSKFLETKDTSMVMKWMFDETSHPGITTALPTFKRYPSKYLLVYMLLQERIYIQRKRKQIEVKDEAILSRYAELKRGGLSGPKAVKELEKWLFDELNLTYDYVSDIIGITINETALRARLNRENAKKR